ncbi:MAG: polysaccharide deacetylase [Synergistaceae bacterium]|nr:polysaccharide deacetylase [Synergistaceae bacterium]
MRKKPKAGREAYLGSVCFFRHLIYLCLFLIVAAPYFCIGALYRQNRELHSQIRDLTLKTLVANFPHKSSLPPKSGKIASNLNYQDRYPDLYCSHQTAFVKKKKTVYLTFDDGPSMFTEKILNILAKHKLKATFFVVGRKDPKSLELLKRIVDDGHTLAPHTYTHIYSSIYASVDSFLDDFNKIHSLIYETTGVKATIFRFPGGTVNAHNRKIYRELSAEMLRRGYIFFDWDVSAADCAKNATETSILNNIINGVHKNGRNIVLMHDTSEETLKALERVIVYLKNKKFAFDRLTNDIAPVTFHYNYFKRRRSIKDGICGQF